MFRNESKVITHVSALKKYNRFIGEEYIVTKNNEKINVFNRLCPHRFYPLGNYGEEKENITCKLHGFVFDDNGKATNNPYKLNCQTSNIGKSGIIFKNFIEPEHAWVEDLANEKKLEYSHSCFGESEGNWLWLMEIQIDLLHVWKDGIHPWLSTQFDPYEVKLEEKDNWVYQKHPTGWWVYIFPYIFLEWSPGCLSINSIYPNDKKSELGYKWITQYYFDPSVSKEDRIVFNRIEEVFREDVRGSEQQKIPFIPYKKAINQLEKQSVYFGDWVSRNRIL